MKKRIIFIVCALLIFIGSLAQAQEKNQQGEQTATGDLSAESGVDRLHFKNVYLTFGGFFESTGLFRSANENSDVGSTYRDIPLNGTANSKLTEFRGTARQSRISLMAETEVMGKKVTGYYETDFLGAATTANETESNSWTPRLRQVWTTIDFPSGFSITTGQAWSLLTTHRNGLRPKAEFIPATIDAQYVVGYNWARQWQLRFVQDFGGGVFGAVSLENPETNTTGVVTPTLCAAAAPTYPCINGLSGSNNAGSPSSLLNANTVSTDIAPDVVGKMVFEPGWGHWELKALGRAFRTRLSAGQFNGTNRLAFGGGVGMAALLPLAPTLTLVVEGLAGAGIGRYASAQGPDVIVRADGTPKAIRAGQLLAGLEWHPTSAWDIYTYNGLEYYERTVDGGIGYGSQAQTNASCIGENPTFAGGDGKCASNKSVYQTQNGFWYRFFKGKEGTAALGLSYSYTHRQLWSDAAGQELRGGEHVAMTSFRYYLP
jgi:hypothetical protein